MITSSDVEGEGGEWERYELSSEWLTEKRQKLGRAWGGGRGHGGEEVGSFMRRVQVGALSLRAQNQQGDHMSEPSAAPVAAPASMPMAIGAPAL